MYIIIWFTSIQLHALKGSSASIGFIQLSQLCKQLEKDGISDDSYLLLKQVLQASINALELKISI